MLMDVTWDKMIETRKATPKTFIFKLALTLLSEPPNDPIGVLIASKRQNMST